MTTDLTPVGAAVLERIVKPFKLRVDWLCWHAYGDKVVVELHVMDEEPRVIHRCDTPPEAIGWARKWLADRGFGFLCNVDHHQRNNDTHITLHACPRGEETQ